MSMFSQAMSGTALEKEAARCSSYPMVEDVRAVSRRVAIAVGLVAQQAGVAEQTAPEELERRVTEQMWVPHYPRLKYKAEA